MDFLKLAWEYEWITLDELKTLVITKATPWGQITPDEFKEITGKDFKE